MSEKVDVLIIDDSEDDRDLYRRALLTCKAASYGTSEASDGDDGVKQSQNHTPDCILLDYSLPGRNGVEVLKQLKAIFPFVPVVMLTGLGNEAVAVSAMHAGAQNYLTKSSITSDSLHHVIQLAIAHCLMEKRLDQQRRSLDLFTRALAHDLKEPVRTIKSFLDLLDGSLSFTERNRRFFDHVRSANERMAALIDGVHFYTGMDRGAVETVKEPCAGDRLLNDALLDLSALIQERGAKVTAGQLPLVHGNPSQLRQLLQNLVCNAIRHGNGPSAVHVSAEEEDASWIFRVADNGPGVDEAMRERIFQPFTRLNNGTPGLGLGLAICKRIAEAHGGDIWCEGRAEGGAAFAFRVPKETGPATDAAAVADCAAPQDEVMANILVVDDNEVDIELARIILVDEEKLHCNLLTATGAEQAWDILRDHHGAIDLLLLDINMPGTDGFELLRRIRADESLKGTPVVMCTTSSYQKDMERARDLGATGYMSKPATLASLQRELPKMPTLRLREAEGQFDLLKVA